MKLIEFFRGQLSEADGTPSNNRVMLFLFLTTIMLMLLVVTFAPVIKPGMVVKLPEIPASFETTIEWVTGILVSGGAIGKGIKAYTAGKTDPPPEQ